jgi:hypothetical protein
MSKSLFAFALGLAVTLSVASVRADALPPGGNIPSAGGGLTQSSPTFVASETGTLTTSGGDVVNFLESVLRETPSNTLDFVYQFSTPLNADNIGTITAQFYNLGATPISAGVYPGSPSTAGDPLFGKGYLAQSGTGAIVSSTSLSSNATTITWTYAQPSGVGKSFASNNVSQILDIQTSATLYDNKGIVGAIDNGPGQSAYAFEPVPEPAVYQGILGLVSMGGLGGLGLVWRRRR